MDVVLFGDISLWEYFFFFGYVEVGEVWGRGVFDNKGMGVMYFFSLLEIVEWFWG